MRKKICSGIELLNGFMILTGVVSILSLLLASLMSVSYVSQFLTLLPILGIYLVSLIADRVSRGFLLFLVVAVGALCLSLLLPMSLANRIVFFALAVILYAIAIANRLKNLRNPLTRPNIVAPCFFAVLYIIAICVHTVECSLMVTLSYYLTFAYIILFVIYKNFSKLDSYLEINQFVQNIPTKQIDKTNYGVLGIYVGVLTVLMIVLPLTGAGNLFVYLWKGLKFLLSLIHITPDDNPYQPPEIEEADNSGADNLDFVQEKPTPAWVTALYEVLTYVLVIAVGLGILILIVVLIIRMVKAFYRPTKENEDVQEFITGRDDKKSSTLRPISEIFRKPDWLDFSPNATVRRAYRKTILKKSADKPSSAWTPTELEENAGLPKDNDTALLHSLYLKARYTAGGVTKEEAKALKS